MNREEARRVALLLASAHDCCAWCAEAMTKQAEYMWPDHPWWEWFDGEYPEWRAKHAVAH